MTELLAPVGSKEALIAAVESGADAVYLAGKAFGARASAPNFDDEELCDAIRLAHLRNVQVYVTVNTLIDDSEVPLLISYLRYLYKIEVDAIIVQDVGVAKLAQKVVPDLPLHASTQMTIHNLAGVEYLEKLGFSRVVLAREVSLKDIEHICKNTKVEIEVFMHGALCICYSGQCLMSSMIGGRSGNRGRCAQPCRLPYTLVDAKGQDVLLDKDAGEYLLSPRDLNTLEILPELIKAGVASFKIEGRMKRPEYVAVVVDTYRRMMDAYLANADDYVVTSQDYKDLAQIFNRDFTTAFLKGKEGRNMMSDRRPNNRGVRIGRVLRYDAQTKMATIKLDESLSEGDIIDFWVKVGGRVNSTVTKLFIKGQEVSTSPAGSEVTVQVPSPVRDNDRVFKVFDARLMERARSFFAGGAPVRRVPVRIAVTVTEGQPMIINIEDNEGFCAEAVTDFIAQKALKRPLTEETIRKQMDRLGTTIFSLNELMCDIQGEVMVPVSEMNEARRKAAELLEEARLLRFKRPPLKETVSIKELVPPRMKLTPKTSKLTLNVDSLEKAKAALTAGADVILFGGESFNHRAILDDEYKKVVEAVREYGKKIIFNTPRLVKEWQIPALKKNLALFQELRPDGISIANLGTLPMAKELTDLPLYGDYSLNVYNSVAVDFFSEQGVKGLTLSPELTLNQVEEIRRSSKIELTCLVHGYLTLMVSEYCVLGSFLGDLHTGRCKESCVKGDFWLKDRKDERFPIVTDQFCRMHVLNAKELSMVPHIGRFGAMGIDEVRIEGKYMKEQEIVRLTKAYKKLLKNEDSMTEAEKLALEHGNITRGHYFRGVL